MAVNGLSPYSTKFRLGGLATGLDTDQMVSDLMRAERMPLDKLSGRRQLAVWRRDSYRDITTLLKGFKSDYMDSLTAKANALSSTFYKKFSATVTDSGTGAASTVVSATGNADASAGTHLITVNSLATADESRSSKSVSGAAIDFTGPLVFAADKTLKISLDGTERQITFSTGETYNNITELVTAVQSKLNTAFGSTGRILVGSDGNGLKFTTGDTTTIIGIADGSGVSAAGDLQLGGVLGTYSAGVTKALQGGNFDGTFDFTNKKFNFTLDGVTKEIKFTSDPADADTAKTALQGLIDTAFGSGKVRVDSDGTKLTFTSIGGASKITLASAATDDALTKLGFTSGDTNRLSTTSSLGALKTKFATTLNFAVNSTVSSEAAIARSVSSTDAITNTTWSGKSFKLNIDGVTKDITFTTDPATVGALATTVQGLIDAEFGAGKVTVSESPAGKLQFVQNDGVGYMKFTSGTTNALSYMKISSGTSTSLIDKSFNLDIDGLVKEVKFTANPTTTAEMATMVGGLIDAQFGAGKVVVTEDPAGRLKFAKGAGTGYMTFTSGTNDALAVMNITSGANADDQIKFTINSKTFTFKASDTLSKVMSTINSDSAAGVNMTYDETSDKFIIRAKQMGAGNNIVVTESEGNFFSAVSNTNNGTVTTEGTDASVVIDGQTLTRSSNDVTVSGVTYTLLKTSSTQQKVSLSMDVESIYKNISDFVTKYNEVIDTLNKKLTEEYDRDYQPLTAEQKEELSEDEVKKWEEKAKTGLLRNDPIIQKIVYSMRKAVSETVEGVTTYLSDIGITTGDYLLKGKLLVDENKLKDSIRNNPDAIRNIFSKRSTTHPAYSRDLTPEQRTVRDKEQGIINRFSDIIEDNISIFRTTGGKKGILLEKAGVVGDASEFDNTYYDEIKNYDKKINALNNRLADKEAKYYQKFAVMEKMIAQMNSQSGWLNAQMGGGQ